MTAIIIIVCCVLFIAFIGWIANMDAKFMDAEREKAKADAALPRVSVKLCMPNMKHEEPSTVLSSSVKYYPATETCPEFWTAPNWWHGESGEEYRITSVYTLCKGWVEPSKENLPTTKVGVRS